MLRHKPLSIIGKGKGWELAPYDVESWGATQLILRRNVDRVVDMNDYSNNRWGANETKEAEAARAKAKELNIPYIDLSNYPINLVIAFFETDYFSNTIDYMIALAVYEGYTELDLYGVNMARESEYYYEKPGVDYWCGQAMGRGIKVRRYGELSTVMRTNDGKLYGYGWEQKQ
jgi:hypothetical protein